MTLHRKEMLRAGTVLALGMISMSPALARTSVTPYLEIAQVLDAQIQGGNDVLTYSSIAAGVEATVESSRTQAQIAYRYERRIGWGKRLSDSDTHSGLARVTHQFVPNVLSVDAGALATRTRGDIRGAAPALNRGNTDNVTQVYSAYAGPTLSTQAGPLQVNAAYRLGYTKVESNDFTPTAGQPRLDNFDDSVSHLATASVGMKPDILPFGWTVGAAYEREDAGQLDQRYESKGVRGDVVVPVAPTVALLGGIGYEDIKASQRSPLLDAGGNAVINNSGRFVTDPNSPRQIAYDFSGVYWDVGVGWKPSNRTNLEAYVGRRYGTMSYTGSFTWAPTSNSAFQIGVYDQVQTFGQQLTDSLAALPTSFNTRRNPLGDQFGGCVFGNGGQQGGCLNSAFQSVNSAVYRSRGVSAQYSVSEGPFSAGVGAGYSQRSYRTPTTPGVFTLNGVKDEAFFGEGNFGYRIDSNSSIDTSIYASLFKSGIIGAPDVLQTGATGAYNRRFGQHLNAVAAVGLYSSRIDGQPTDSNASALLGMRYSF